RRWCSREEIPSLRRSKIARTIGAEMPTNPLTRFLQPGEPQIQTISHNGEVPDRQPLVTITIDGKTVQALEGQSVLRAAQAAGIHIPTLCDDERLAPAAACRMCLVEVEGEERPLPSCTLAAREGMSVVATNERLKKQRQTTLE